MMSPRLSSPSPSTSVTEAVLVASRISVPNSMFSVGSSTVFPSLSIPSSLKSVTEAVNEFAVTEAWFDNPPPSIAS